MRFTVRATRSLPYMHAILMIPCCLSVFGSGAFALHTVVMPNVTVVETSAFCGTFNLNCIISPYLTSMENLIENSCQSRETCSPLFGCPQHLQYPFSNGTVSVDGLSVANIANDVQIYDATLINGATVSNNQLVLQSKDKQFMQIKNVAVDNYAELTITFWFRASSIDRGTICEFSSSSEIFRIYLSSGMLRVLYSFQLPLRLPIVAAFVADQWYHVVGVQAIHLSDDDRSGKTCDWSIFLNGKALQTTEETCTMYGNRNLNYLGKSSASENDYFNGSIRDFRLYNSALSLTDVEILYSNTNPTLFPTMAPTSSPSLVPTFSPSATPPPSALPTYVPTYVGLLVSPLSTAAIAGIVVAGTVFLVALFVGFYFHLKPKTSFMEDLMIRKQNEFTKHFTRVAASVNARSDAMYSTESDISFDPLMETLKELLDTGEKWRKCYHNESDHDDKCFVELWRSPLNNLESLMCTDCSPPKPITLETMPEKFRYEKQRMEQDIEKYDFDPLNSVNRGLSIGFLVALCRKFNLWKVPTWQVRRDYIIPMTKDYRCRFVDLPAMQGSGIIGQADIFISFSNATLFGDLVAAFSDGADYKRRVWIDIFAVMQWPSVKSDLNFDKVIQRCPTFLSVCSSVDAVGRHKNISGFNELSKEDKKMIPYCRVWCLFEIFHAAICKKAQEERLFISNSFYGHLFSPNGTSIKRNVDYHKSSQVVDGDSLYGVCSSPDLENPAVLEFVQDSSPHTAALTILFKTGSCEVAPDGSHIFKVDKKMLSDLITYIDINNADATSEDDKEWIFNQIKTGYSKNGGIAGLNRLVTEVLTTAKILDSDPILESAVRGDGKDSIEAIHSLPELYILNTYRGGLTHVLRSMMKVNHQSMVKVSIYNRLEVSVEIYMVGYNGASLNYAVNLEKHKSASLPMAEGSFWIARNLDDSDVGVYIAAAAMKPWIIY